MSYVGYNPVSQASITQSNLAYNQANTATYIANLAFDKANTGATSANVSIANVGGGVIMNVTSRIATSAANTITIDTASVSRITIDPTGNVGFGTTTPQLRVDIVGAAKGSITTLTDSSNVVTPDFASNNFFLLTLTNNFSMANATNVRPGMSGGMWVMQPTGGSKTLNFAINYKFEGNIAPTITTAANSVDFIAWSVRSANSIVCSYIQDVGNRNDT